jgi:acyl-CoA hydrolase
VAADCSVEVVAEVDPKVPRARGAAIDRASIDLVIESEQPMACYRAVVPRPENRLISKRIIRMLPEAPVLQIGIGSASECLVDELIAQAVPELSFLGMATDAMADVAGHGLLRDHKERPAINATELMGTATLMQFANDNPLLAMRTSEELATPMGLAAFDRLVSVNSAVQVDLGGQVNAEWAGGREISGVGGSIDYAEGALHTVGGLRIVALPSTNSRHGSSRIVHALDQTTPITHARHGVDVVVTEYGAAELSWRSARERALALIDIAHPDHRRFLAKKADLGLRARH